MRNNLTLTNFLFNTLEVFIMNEEMMVMEETTAVAVVDDAEIAELAEVNGVEVEGEVVEATETNGVNPVVAAGIGLGVTGIVGGLTYLFLKKKRKNKAKTNGETKKVKEDSTKKPATEAELEEYLKKLAEEMKAANEELIKIKKNNEETEDEKKGNEEE